VGGGGVVVRTFPQYVKHGKTGNSFILRRMFDVEIRIHVFRTVYL
jgi:hypothetical protein